MNSKLLVFLIVGAFPYLIFPLYLVYFLSTRLPEPYRYFFSDYSPLLLSVWYGLPLAAWGIYWLMKRRHAGHTSEAARSAGE